MIHGERHVHAWRRRVNQSGRIADGAAARAMKIACLRFDLHRQIETFHQTRIHRYGCGERIVQWHAGCE